MVWVALPSHQVAKVTVVIRAPSNNTINVVIVGRFTLNCRGERDVGAIGRVVRPCRRHGGRVSRTGLPATRRRDRANAESKQKVQVMEHAGTNGWGRDDHRRPGARYLYGCIGRWFVCRSWGKDGGERVGDEKSRCLEVEKT